VSQFISFIFNLFSYERREKLAGFQCKERNLLLTIFFAAKIIDFGVNEFHFIKGA
jgi:hypothetical protein